MAGSPSLARCVKARRMVRAVVAPALEALRQVPRDELVLPDAPERFVDAFVDSLDLEALGFIERRRPNRRSPHSVRVLLKVVLFAAVERVVGHRALAKACAKNLCFLFLCACNPPKSTLWRFWRDFHHVFPRIFNLLVQRAAEVGLVEMDLHALDGTKIRAASSMHTAVHREGEQKKLARLDRQLEKLEEALSAQSVQELRFQQERVQADRRQALDRIALLDKHDTQHLHPNEPDARVMKCDPRPLLAYNGQAVVDHESDLIVAIGLSTEESDHELLVPMMETKRVLGAVAKMTDADAGYASGEQLQQAHQRHLPVLVSMQAEPDKGLLPKSSFAYDEERDAYVCPRGEHLTLEGHSKRSSDARFARAVYRCHTVDCPERAACSKDPKGRTVKRTPFEDDLKRQRTQMAKPALRTLYELRKEIIEHIFGCIKSNDNFRRFSVRGLAKAFAQWALACIALDLRKLREAWAAGLFRWPPRTMAYA